MCSHFLDDMVPRSSVIGNIVFNLSIKAEQKLKEIGGYDYFLMFFEGKKHVVSNGKVMNGFIQEGDLPTFHCCVDVSKKGKIKELIKFGDNEYDFASFCLYNDSGGLGVIMLHRKFSGAREEITLVDKHNLLT